MKRYCGMRMTAEAMAFLGMISADEYMRLTGDDPLRLSVQEQAERKARSRAVTDRNNARNAKRRALIVGEQ